jgi:hypothetical protein
MVMLAYLVINVVAAATVDAAASHNHKQWIRRCLLILSPNQLRLLRPKLRRATTAISGYGDDGIFTNICLLTLLQKHRFCERERLPVSAIMRMRVT